MQIMTGIVAFLIWTLILYSIHRLAHTDYFPLLNKLHQDHHMTIDENRELGPVWSNIFLYSDSWRSTVDMWVSEVIPTLLFCLISGFWWIFGVYYIWTAFIQERIEHDKNFNLYPWFTSEVAYDPSQEF